MAFRRFARWIVYRRGNVAMLSAVLLPAMTAAAGLGIEVSNWGLQQTEMQVIADSAARAAAAAIKAGWITSDALNAGADLAELNGITGVTQRVWDGNTNTITDGNIVVARVTGIRKTSGFAYRASVTKPMPLIVAKLFTSFDSVTISGVGYAELVQPTASACLIALGTASPALQLDNNASINESNCATQVNGSIHLNNNTSIITAGITAGGTITGSGTVTGPRFENGGTMLDPLASLASVQTAITTTKSLSSSTILGAGASYGSTLLPGNYGGMSLGNNTMVTLSPGTYYINGNITTGNSTVVNGTGVTIVYTGTLTTGNSNTFNLSAPKAGASSGIPGMVFIGSSTSDLTFSNGTTVTMTGVSYYPNGKLYALNNMGTSSSTCSIFIVKTIQISNNANFSNSCASDSGVQDLPINIGTTKVTLVR